VPLELAQATGQPVRADAGQGLAQLVEATGGTAAARHSFDGGGQECDDIGLARISEQPGVADVERRNEPSPR
jgi:hypothetical protein